ncbi:MAG: prepilin-type N-terminal cleavage/methylation domain-containing protein [Gammaproteobacteria bacterium]|nr:prepilin-type N-terminal cleavage/methylation domain-containing protein [Gammaproteobacteria bacterium]
MQQQYSIKTCSGFTLVELITTMIIVGVLATVGLPKFFDSQSFRERGFFDELIHSIRYAQKVAIGSHCEVQVLISTTTFALKQPSQANCGASPTSFPITVSAPYGSVAGTTPNGISISGNTFLFDASGSPSVAQTITVNSRSFKIHNNTGYVEKL